MCRDNLNSGLFLTEASNITIRNSIFEFNTAASKYSQFKGLKLRYRTAGGLSLFFINGTQFVYTLVKNCSFRYNSARVNETNQRDAELRPKLYVPRGFGGGLLVSFQNTVGHRVAIKNCSFSSNYAEFSGGAISIQFYRGVSNSQVVQPSSHDNRVTVEDCMFVNNTCLEQGGAIGVNTFETANENRVIVNGSVFNGNHAYQNGGAFSNIIEVKYMHQRNLLLTCNL